MTPPPLSPALTQAEFEEMIRDIRPALHRYVARMIGSTVDAEDVVQDALVKAHASLALLTSRSNVRGWLFRIAHNKAVDQLRRDHDQPLELLDEYPMTVEPDQPLEEKELAALALSVFLKLAPRQRSCVILKDVLGYSLAEISELLNATVPEIKAALHRGRTRLRELAPSAEVRAPILDERQRELLARYVDRFNARDFEAVRAMLAAEVRLDLVGRTKLVGAAEVNTHYFYNYNLVDDWRLALGLVEGRLAILVYDPAKMSLQPDYFVLLTWEDSQVSQIRDYRYARYVMQDAEIRPV
jgi:RNA polymerase sigma-70 factor (ECF subfamily)